MKQKLVLLVTLAAAAIPVLASSATIAPSHAPITDSERGALAHRETRGSSFDAKRKAPIAYGYVNPDGSTASGSGNFSSSYDSSNAWYVVSIPGVSYFFSSFSTTVTPSLPHNAICDTDSIGGSMLVRCFDPSGNSVQAEFGFTTF